MFKRKTSPSKKARRNLRTLELRVNSPRIFWFQTCRASASLLKFAFIIAIIGAGIWGAKKGIDHYFIDNPDYQLKCLTLKTNGVLQEQEIYEVLQLRPFESLFHVDLKAARQILLERDDITFAKVDRLLPDTLEVSLTERRPVAWLEYRHQGVIGRSIEHGLLIDKEGYLFTCTEAHWADAARLPVIIIDPVKRERFRSGGSIQHSNAKRLLNLAILSSDHLQNADWKLPLFYATKNKYSFQARTSDGALITFGLDDHERQMADLVTLVEHSKSQGRRIATANLIPSKNIPVKYFGSPASPPQANNQPSSIGSP